MLNELYFENSQKKVYLNDAVVKRMTVWKTVVAKCLQMGYRENSANFSRDSAFALGFMNIHLPLCNRPTIVPVDLLSWLVTRDDCQVSCSRTVTLHYTVQLFCRGRWLTYDDKCWSVTAALACLRDWLRNAASSSDHHTSQYLVFC